MAGRIPQHFIDQLLNRIDIVDLIDSYVPLKKAGANYKACCPFHNEKTPSFTVSPTKQFYHCFGCGANGTAISWLMEYEHMEFREAIEKLASNAGLEIPEESQGHDHSQQKKKSVSQGIDLYNFMAEISDYYQLQLRQHKTKQQAISYLQNRNLSGEIAKKFGLGFAPEGWDNVLSSFGTSDAHKKALMDAGMLSQNDKERIYDRFRHRIMFPILDHRGRVVGFGGRVLDANVQPGNPKYLNSPETPIFHKGSELYGLFAARGAIKENDGVLVVEGYMDVVALAQAGIDNAVATLGTATTPMHLQRLFRHTKNVTFSFDGDRAGRAAAGKALETCLPLLNDGFQISFLFLPDGEDPDSMVNKIGKEAFSKLVTEATPLPEFLIDNLQQQADINRLDGRAKLASLAKPLIQQIPKGVLRTLIIERLAKLTQASAQDIAGPSKKTSHNKSSANTGQRKHNTVGSTMSSVRRALSLILQYPHLANQVSDITHITDQQVRGITVLHNLLDRIASNPQASTASLLEGYRQEAFFATLSQLANHQHNNMESLSNEEATALLLKENNRIIEESQEFNFEVSDATTELSTLTKKKTVTQLNESELKRKHELEIFIRDYYKPN